MFDSAARFPAGAKPPCDRNPVRARVPAVSPSRSRVDIPFACPEPFPSSSRTFFRAMRHVPPARCVFIHRARFRAVRACARDAIVRRQSRCRVSL